jgi:hypothetical protein
MKPTIACLALLASALLSGCALSPAAGTSAIPVSSGSGGPTGTYIYSARNAFSANNVVIGSFETNFLAGEILSYPANSTGTNVAPTSTLVGPAYTFLQMIRGDGNGHIYALYGFVQPSVTVAEYSAAGNGILTPVRSFTYTFLTPNGSLDHVIETMAADRSGNVYLGTEANTILAFAPTASGAATPSFTLSNVAGSNMTTDSSGNLYVATENVPYLSSTISIYNAGFGPISTPSRSILCTGFWAYGLAVDAAGSISVTVESSTSDVPGALIFAPNATTPGQTLTGPSSAGVVNVDSAGNMYVFDHEPNTTYSTYSKFSPGANGTDPPTASFTDQPDLWSAPTGSIVVH